MSKDFFEINSDDHGTKAPIGLPRSGKKSDITRTLIQNAIDSSGKKKDNLVFKGKILYASYIPEFVFKKKFWPDFVNYVLKGSKYANRKDYTDIIIESIVYVPELCDCLPRPGAAEGQQFLDTLNNFALKNRTATGRKSFDSIAKESENLSQIQNGIKFFNQIRRFPRAYVSMGTLGKEPSFLSSKARDVINKIVDIKFPYEYDTSVGLFTLETK